MLDRIFFQDQANVMCFGNGTQCLLQSDVDLKNLCKMGLTHDIKFAERSDVNFIS